MPPSNLCLSTLHKSPYGWPLRQLRIPQAHTVTQGDPEVVVAVIDLGYRFHPHHKGHLWVNPDPTRGDRHGWDCHDDDASLEYNLQNPDTAYHRGHHAFVVGEVIACAPGCRVMIVRVGYDNPDSWWKGIDYAVENGAKILIMPHGFISHGPRSPIPLFYRGTDFSYPIDNPRIRRALDDAYDAGCLIFKGTADNRGRRVACAVPGLDTVVAVGSSNRKGQAADICCSADYVEVATPGGERSSKRPTDQVWCTGGDRDYIPFTGGCMASGFAGGVAALAMSRFPDLTNEQIRQILRNTARGDGWNPELGWGVLDANRAVSLKPTALCQRLRILPTACAFIRRKRKPVCRIAMRNRGVFDIERALVAAFNGAPLRAAAPEGTMQKSVTLVTRQIGHAIGAVRGLDGAVVDIELTEKPTGPIWIQACTLDRHGSDEVHTVRLGDSDH